MIKQRVYYSDRGFPLVYNGDPPGFVPVLTIEAYCKWYTYSLVNINGSVESVCFYEAESLMPNCESAYHDHVPNPRAMVLLANDRHWQLDREAYEMVLGRHMLEVLGNDPGECYEAVY